MDTFSSRRMFRIFREDQKSLIVAMDHGSAMNVFPDLLNTQRIIEEVVENGADAFLTTFGIVKNFWRSMKGTGVIMRLDGGVSSIKSEGKSYNQLFGVEDALSLGADAVACMGLPGTEDEPNTLTYLSKLAAEAHLWDVPLMAEMLPGGFMNKEMHTPDLIAQAARMGVELGADFIKTDYPKDIESFKRTVQGVFRPIVVLGGSRSDDPRDLLAMVKDAINAGASGVAIGRNIWGYHKPGLMTAALRRIIHEGASVEQAAAMLQ